MIYNEEAKLIATLIKDKNRIKLQIGEGEYEVLQVSKDDSCKIKVENLNIIVRNRDVSSISRWHAGELTDTWGSATNWNAQSVMDAVAWSIILKRAWQWNTRDLLAQGTYSNNINISDNVIQLSR